MGVAVGDVDGNGFDDIFVAAYGPDLLLLNQDGRRFVDATATSGLGDPRWGRPRPSATSTPTATSTSTWPSTWSSTPPGPRCRAGSSTSRSSAARAACRRRRTCSTRTWVAGASAT